MGRTVLLNSFHTFHSEVTLYELFRSKQCVVAEMKVAGRDRGRQKSS